MKTNTFTKFFIGIFLLASLFNCDNDLLEPVLSEEQNTNNLELYRGNLEDFPEIGELFQKTVTDKKTKASKNDLYEFVLDSSSVSKITLEDDIFYSFIIKRENPEDNIMENLVISDKAEQEPSAFIINYSPDAAYWDRFEEDPNTFFSGQRSMVPLDSDRLNVSKGCFTISTTYCNYDGHEDNDAGPGVAGPACTDVYTVTNVVCIDAGDSSDGGGGATGNGSSGGGGSGSSGGGTSGQNNDPLPDLSESTIITTMTLDLSTLLRDELGYSSLSSKGRWVEDDINEEIVREMFTFLNREGYSDAAKEFVDWEIDFELLPPQPCGIGHDCIESIKFMAEGLRKFHGEEGTLMADYFDSLVEDLNSFTLSDLQVYYDNAKTITERYNNYMRSSIVGAYEEGVGQILEIVLFEVGGNAAINLMQKIPIGWVFRGARLNNMVKKVGLLGQQGFNNAIREVQVNAPITKARELFNSLTKHAVSKSTEANGAIKANMGNGNFITYRPSSASTSNIPATISLDFKGIWSQTRQVKFINL